MSAMSSWKTYYRERTVDAETALKSVLSDGCRVYITPGCAEPRFLVKALFSVIHHYMDVELIQNLSMGEIPEDLSPWQKHCRLRTFFVGPKSRQAVNWGLADYIPAYFSSIPNMFKPGGHLPLDVCLIHVTPPDEHGFCSLGISVEITRTAAEHARFVVAQVNEKMPRTMGDTFLHVTQISYFVEHTEPLMEVAQQFKSAIYDRIGQYVARLVEDSSTIQTGIGRITDAATRNLVSKKDLGLHSDMITDTHMELIEKGIITGRHKTLHPNKAVATFCLGTERLYRFVHNNPQVELYPTEYVNNSMVISQNRKMVAINAALEIDITGQVCADSIGHKIYSGIGGYIDFMLGASKSEDGKTIILVPSTSPDGRKSRIVTHLSSGAGVVNPRSTVWYVVNEFGIANLFGKAIRERALALINIAHPKFREKLLAEAKRIRYVYQDQILPPIYEPLYPGQWEVYQVFPGDLKVFFRPIKPTDERALQEFFYSLPDQDIYYRFLSAMKVFPHRDIQAMCNIDYEHEMAIVGIVGDINKNETIIALGRYILDQRSNMAEVDFAVRAEYQRRGIGTFLLHYLCEIAKSKGITGFCAYVLASNRRMLSVFHKVGYVIHSHLEEGVYEIWFRFDEPAQVCITE
jgi:acyl-CoA hydrolase/GNAT superfamily N-acetyltransferase